MLLRDAGLFTVQRAGPPGRCPVGHYRASSRNAEGTLEDLGKLRLES